MSRAFLLLAATALLCGSAVAQSTGEPDFSKLREKLELRLQEARTRALSRRRPGAAPSECRV